MSLQRVDRIKRLVAEVALVVAGKVFVLKVSQDAVLARPTFTAYDARKCALRQNNIPFKAL